MAGSKPAKNDLYEAYAKQFATQSVQVAIKDAIAILQRAQQIAMSMLVNNERG